MKKNIFVFISIIAAFFIISCSNTSVDGNGCYIDIDDAVKAANKNNQDIMIIVSLGTDGEDSSDFINNVVCSSEFKSDIASKYSVVCMDFSQKAYEATTVAEDADDSAKKAAEKNAMIMQKNAKYATMLNVTETPAIFLLSKEQYFITGLYYDEEKRTLDGFKSVLADHSALIDDMHKMIYQTKIGNSEEKIHSIDALYEATNPSYRFFLYDLIASVPKLDPSNKTGLVGKYLYDAAVAKSDKAIFDGDVKNAVQAYLDIIDLEAIPAESRQEALYTAAFMCSRSGLEEKSVVINYLEKAIELAPESEAVPAIQRVITALNTQTQE